MKGSRIARKELFPGKNTFKSLFKNFYKNLSLKTYQLLGIMSRKGVVSLANTENTKKEVISIAYDGASLARGSMDVKDLAPALMAISELFQEANSTLNGNAATVVVSVRSDFKKGSFQVDLEVVVPILATLFGSAYIQNAANLATILGFLQNNAEKPFVSLIDLIAFAKGRMPKKATKIDEETISIMFEGPHHTDIEEITVTKPVGDLYVNVKAREQVQNIVKPVKAEGVDKFIIKSNDHKTITKEELPYYETPEYEEILLDETSISYLNLVAINFKEGNQWKFTDKVNEFWAPISDSIFVQKVESNEFSFSKSDTLKVKLRKIQKQTVKGLDTSYEVIEVLDHRPAKQLKLNFEE